MTFKRYNTILRKDTVLIVCFEPNQKKTKQPNDVDKKC